MMGLLMSRTVTQFRYNVDISGEGENTPFQTKAEDDLITTHITLPIETINKRSFFVVIIILFLVIIFPKSDGR